MAGTLTDAEKLAHIRQIIEDEERLEAHYSESGVGTAELAQMSAFNEIRRFLCTPETHVPVPPKPRRPSSSERPTPETEGSS